MQSGTQRPDHTRSTGSTPRGIMRTLTNGTNALLIIATLAALTTAGIITFILKVPPPGWYSNSAFEEKADNPTIHKHRNTRRGCTGRGTRFQSTPARLPQKPTSRDRLQTRRPPPRNEDHNSRQGTCQQDSGTPHATRGTHPPVQQLDQPRTNATEHPPRRATQDPHGGTRHTPQTGPHTNRTGIGHNNRVACGNSHRASCEKLHSRRLTTSHEPARRIDHRAPSDRTPVPRTLHHDLRAYPAHQTRPNQHRKIQGLEATAIEIFSINA